MVNEYSEAFVTGKNQAVIGTADGHYESVRKHGASILETFLKTRKLPVLAPSVGKLGSGFPQADIEALTKESKKIIESIDAICKRLETDQKKDVLPPDKHPDNSNYVRISQLLSQKQTVDSQIHRYILSTRC